MPNRIVREGILTSERVEQLDPQAEVFYRRLLSKVDDHGLYDARPSVLRASLYPLRLDRVREADCSRWIAACEKAGLIVLYEAGGKPYLKVLDTRWQARSEPRYPPPTFIPADPEQLQTTARNCKQVLPIAPLVVVVDEDVKDTVGQDRTLKQQALEILIFLNEKAGRGYQPVEVNLDLITSRLLEGATPEVCRAVIEKKCRDWMGDDKMSQFLRPATLFNRTKFAQYQGELGAKPSVKVDL